MGYHLVFYLVHPGFKKVLLFWQLVTQSCFGSIGKVDLTEHLFVYAIIFLVWNLFVTSKYHLTMCQSLETLIGLDTKLYKKLVQSNGSQFLKFSHPFLTSLTAQVNCWVCGKSIILLLTSIWPQITLEVKVKLLWYTDHITKHYFLFYKLWILLRYLIILDLH